MPHTNSWLCQYAICQLGRPYWFATSGQIADADLYYSRVVGSGYYYTDYDSQYGEKVHDCSGLIVGALTCSTVDNPPDGSTSVAHGATSQFFQCSPTSETMSDFPYIPGTLVFHTNGEYKSHVGIYVGEFIDADGDSHSDAVVEAMGHYYGGVVTSDISNSKWDAWGQLEACEVDTVKGQKFDARSKSEVKAGSPTITINTQKMKPFIVTVLPGYDIKIDYSQIKEARVSGMMFFAGELYDVSHRKHTYKYSKLPELVDHCNNAGLPYALYVNVRARTEIEADEECRALYYVVSEFSPTLGLWLSLHQDNGRDLNDKILNIYYKYIEKWGLKARCGLYVTPQQLSLISWDSFKDRFYLWQIDPMDVSKVDDELLDPSMFEVPDNAQ